MLWAVRAWIFLSTVLVGAGWILSALHQLNRIGYLLVFVIMGGMVWTYRKFTALGLVSVKHNFLVRFFWRFRHPAPLLFLVLSVMVLLGGVLYDSSNVDTNSYRLPRILHWLWQEQWHLIRSGDLRVNFAGVGWEWLAAPLVLFSKTDHPLFLINFVSFLLMPGLIFSVFRRLKVSGRIAWWWMWLLPTGWCYLFQAGSVTNDAFATIYALAAVDFALRASEKKSVRDLWWSMLAVALLTGVKQTNIPLALLWFIPVVAGWKLLGQRIVSTILVSLFALLVSIAPITISNLQHYGNWLGLAPGQWKGVLTSPFWGVVGNAFIFPAQNLLPPFFPWAESWNARMDRFSATPFGSHFSSFEHFGILSRNVHGVAEGNAGIGLGVCLLLALTIVAAWKFRGKEFSSVTTCRDWPVWFLQRAPWGLLLLFWAKVGTYENARQFAPYYPFLLPWLLVAEGQSIVVRRIWWQRLAILMMMSSALLLVISRARPLFPMQTVLSGLEAKFPHSHLVKRVAFSFSVRSVFGPEFKGWIEQNIPRQEKVVGLGSISCEIEPTIWLPYGRWRVERIMSGDRPEQWKPLGIHYILIDKDYLEAQKAGIEAWMQAVGAELVSEYKYQLQAASEPEVDYLVHLRN